jgi:hypothetical protein
MNKTVFSAIFTGVALMGEPAHAFEVPEISLVEKINQSSLVAIGRVSAINAESCLIYYNCAKVEVSKILKGHSERNIQVRFGGELIELRPNCCDVGKTYMFYLKNGAQGIYESVNPPHGIFEIPTSPASGTAK